MPVPSNWRDHSILHPDTTFFPPANGFASYKLKFYYLKILLPLSISMEGADTAYDLYVNGVLFSSKGKLEKQKKKWSL